MDDRLRTYGGLALAAVLVVAGTLLTGILPSTALYQAIAGAVIVAGFAVVYLTLGALGEW
jgi:fructose-1,6-bisphosphatase/inositol monophosphatase family enzyme